MSKDFNISTNWDVANRTDISDVVTVKYLEQNTPSERDDLDEFVSIDRAVLICKNNTDQCEISLKIKPTHNIALITVITTCSKLEVFKGSASASRSLSEYYKTCYGELIDDFEGIKTFRFDITFDRITTNCSMHMITSEEEIWLYGLQISLQENCKFLQGIMSTSRINLAEVQQMLDESKFGISENAQKCKNFLETYTNLTHRIPPEMTNLAGATSSFSETAAAIPNNANLPAMYEHNPLKEIIDNHFIRIEAQIDMKFRDFEERQNEKIDKLMKLMEQLVAK